MSPHPEGGSEPDQIDMMSENELRIELREVLIQLKLKDERLGRAKEAFLEILKKKCKIVANYGERPSPCQEISQTTLAEIEKESI